MNIVLKWKWIEGHLLKTTSSSGFCCFQQVSDMHSHLLSCLHLHLSEIKSFNCAQSLPSIISCNNSILFLSRVALPNIFPSIMSLSKLSCLRTCPSYLCFLHQILFKRLLASLACTNTSSFVTFSVQLIFTILHHVHTSNASNSF